MGPIACVAFVAALVVISAHAAVGDIRDRAEPSELTVPSHARDSRSVHGILHGLKEAGRALHSELHHKVDWLHRKKHHLLHNGEQLADTLAEGGHHLFHLLHGGHGHRADRHRHNRLHKRSLSHLLGWRGHKHHDHKHGRKHGHKYGHKHGRKHGHGHHFWKKLGRGIKNWLHPHRDFRPRQGNPFNAVTHWPAPGTTTTRPSKTRPRWPAAETTTARPSKTWPRWPAPGTTTSRPSKTRPSWPAPGTTTTRPSKTWPRWPAPGTTTKRPSKTWPRSTSRTTTTTTTTTTTAAPPTPTPTSRSRPGGGVVPATATPLYPDVEPACHPGFFYHRASGVCVENCPDGASYRKRACFCDDPSFFVDFFNWRCVPGRRAIE